MHNSNLVVITTKIDKTTHKLIMDLVRSGLFLTMSELVRGAILDFLKGEINTLAGFYLEEQK